MSKVIGIDLGTTYSCVGVFINGKIEIIANDQGNRTTPSYVAFNQTERLAGERAKSQIGDNPENTIFDAKRMIGRSYNDQHVQSDIKTFPFRVINDGDRPKFVVKFKGKEETFSPEEISSAVLISLRQTAEAFLQTDVKDVVVTVPAYFNDNQRQATIDSATIAGLNVKRLISEPSAAAFAYGFDKKKQRDENIFVFDLGGGTFDVSVINIKNGEFNVKSINGDGHLGGEDFDDKIVEFCLNDFKEKSTKDVFSNKRALKRLRTECERAKRMLSMCQSTSIEIDSLIDDIDYKTTISRAHFERLCAELFDRIVGPLKQAMKDAKMDISQISEVILVGGSTRIPKIQRIVSEFFNGKQLNKSINADEAVAFGAAVHGAVLGGDQYETVKDLILHEATPLSLGVEVVGDIMSTVIERNTPIPAENTKYYWPHYCNQTTVCINVYEGENNLIKDNAFLGKFKLTGIPLGSSADRRVAVTFSIDLNRILNVRAVIESTGKEVQCNITEYGSRYSQEDIERMTSSAQRFEQESQEIGDFYSEKNQVEKLIYGLKLTVCEDKNRSMIPVNDREKIKKLCDEKIKKLMTMNTPASSKTQLQAVWTSLKDASDPIMDEFYRRREAALTKWWDIPSIIGSIIDNVKNIFM